MGDGVERAIARDGELETLVANEVSALERAYTDNEVRIRALLQDIAHQRDNLVGQAEQLHRRCNRRQRAAQFMRQRGQVFIFAQVGFFQLLPVQP